jgi:soluble epoxide hydrolase/lipid-phosphate phosphatase
MVVWRMAQWYPDLVTHVVVVCTFYFMPQREYISTEQLVATGRAPQFGYQLHLASPEVEDRIKSEEDIRKFLHGMYGARGSNRETIFSPEKGVLFENLDRIGRTPLLTDSEMDYYVSQYSRNGFHGPLNWYRTREANWRDDLDLIRMGRTTVEQPTLFIQATRDSVFIPAMMSKMGENIPKLTVKPVDANHWALWEKPAECNAILEQWLKEIVLGSKGLL